MAQFKGAVLLNDTFDIKGFKQSILLLFRKNALAKLEIRLILIGINFLL
jgi:hypothetical protein